MDLSHPLDALEIEQRREMAREFAEARDRLAVDRGLEPHTRPAHIQHGNFAECQGGETD
jgi:hypothetical protein